MAQTPSLGVPTHSLYVGDLHPDVTETQLNVVFSSFANFLSSVVRRDCFGRSLCHGFLNFRTSQSAQLAMESMNHTPINGKVIRLMWYEHNPEARRRGIGNVFVKNLDDSIDDKKLHMIFANCGLVLSCKVAVSEDGRSKHYGYVQFDSETSAQNAIQKLNGYKVYGKALYVTSFVPKGQRMLTDDEAKYTNLYVKNFEKHVTEEKLSEMFSKFGKITSLLISKDSDGVSKGFGFVNFENPDSAKQAKESMNGVQLGSKILYVSRAQSKSERQQEQTKRTKGVNVYVKNIGDSVNDDQFRMYFSQCGRVISAKIMRDTRGISKGFGFVSFSSTPEANKAITLLGGKKLFVNVITSEHIGPSGLPSPPAPIPNNA
ncbi:RNA recognition motif domain [Dillenia turbinata]|uniref:RNA recognition motif domain n=1 Tax=Dillenia turbinata TaxID=194707 RepID=A0AAN8VQP9_9MAGN